jgi:DnaJ-class molecular chaperone
MKNHVTKEPKIALCRKCHGKGKIVTKHFIHWKEETCPQCEGSGRVTVSCEMTLDIRPYKPKVEQVID